MEGTVAHTVREKAKLIARVRRIRGQMEAIERGLEAEIGCADVLQLIASKRQRAALKAQARGSQQAADAALEQEALLDDEARFLCLDDVLDEAHDIDLPDAEAWGGAPAARPTHAQLLRRPDLLLLHHVKSCADDVYVRATRAARPTPWTRRRWARRAARGGPSSTRRG